MHRKTYVHTYVCTTAQYYTTSTSISTVLQGRPCSGGHLLKQVALAVLGNEVRAPVLVVFLQHLSTVIKDDLTQEMGEAVAG